MAKFGLTAPWVNFYYEINAFFNEDTDVRVVYEEDENIIDIYVDNAAKAAALTDLLPTEKEFGAITVKINVIPANKLKLSELYKLSAEETSKSQLFKDALENNPHVEEIIPVIGIFNNPITYVIFKKEVVQFFNDSLGDFNGICSTLMQNIANDIFENRDGIYFCTDVKDPSKTLAINAIDANTWKPWTLSVGQ